MRPQRPRRTRRGSSNEVAAGQWVRVPVPGEPFPVHMQIGNTSKAAFIDHEPDGRGGYRTIAARRCPPLPSGFQPVRVTLPDGTVLESEIYVT